MAGRSLGLDFTVAGYNRYRRTVSGGQMPENSYPSLSPTA
jgi:hypothetical protein